MDTRGKIEAGSDLSETEIGAAKNHLRSLLRSNGQLTGCTSYIQRMMQIGYNHGARILEVLEAERFITEPDSKGERHKGAAWTDLAAARWPSTSGYAYCSDGETFTSTPEFFARIRGRLKWSEEASRIMREFLRKHEQFGQRKPIKAGPPTRR